MHFQSIVDATDLESFKKNTIQGENGRYVSKVPEFSESLTYEIKQDKLIVIQETNEDTTITYGQLSYNFRVIPVMFALACAMHRKRILQVGVTEHTVYTHVQGALDRFIASYGETGGIRMHDRKGLVFVEEEEFVVAVPEEVICSLYIEKMTMAIKLFDERYLIRFTLPGGSFMYFPMADLYANEAVRASKYRNLPNFSLLDWEAKRNELETFVEDWTK